MLKRLPDRQSILPVYAVIACLFAAWTITAFLWKLSTWLMFLNLGEILAIFSYGMLTNLFESLLVLLLLLLASALLPAGWLREDFRVRGTLLAVGLIGALMTYLRLYMSYKLDNRGLLIGGPLFVLALTILLLGLAGRSARLRTAAAWLSDRLTVFLFVLAPLFVLLSGYVLIRNLT